MESTTHIGLATDTGANGLAGPPQADPVILGRSRGQRTSGWRAVGRHLRTSWLWAGCTSTLWPDRWWRPAGRPVPDRTGGAGVARAAGVIGSKVGVKILRHGGRARGADRDRIDRTRFVPPPVGAGLLPTT